MSYYSRPQDYTDFHDKLNFSIYPKLSISNPLIDAIILTFD
jgi:hypothetical protein